MQQLTRLELTDSRMDPLRYRVTTPPVFGTHLGVTPLRFRPDLWQKKARIPGQSYSIVCVILDLAILVELQTCYG